MEYYFSDKKEQADPVDMGETIFDDNHGFSSIVMQDAYTYLNPISAIIDVFVKLFK